MVYLGLDLHWVKPFYLKQKTPRRRFNISCGEFYYGYFTLSHIVEISYRYLGIDYYSVSAELDLEPVTD